MCDICHHLAPLIQFHCHLLIKCVRGSGVLDELKGGRSFGPADNNQRCNSPPSIEKNCDQLGNST
jgi:hypothetical protein